MSTHNIHFPNKIEYFDLSQIYYYLQLWKKFWGLKNEFERAVVNQPSVFEPSKFYCIAYEQVLIEAWPNWFYTVCIRP